MHTPETSGVLLTECEDFSPALIFGCGQSFRFEQMEPGLYRGVALGRELTLAETPQGVRLHCTPQEYEAVWRAYFDMDLDYAAVRRAVAVTPFMGEAVDFGRGLRILRQDFWEAACSFLISQCNNIARIKGIVARLCERHGEAVSEKAHAFPSAGQVACLSETELRALGTGYRAPYLLAAARAVAEGRLSAAALNALPYAEAKRALMQTPGIGAKVADCILLYGLHRTDAFPVDVWMRRALAEHFPAGFDPAEFGPHAGIAQQYIFHYERHLYGKAV